MIIINGFFGFICVGILIVIVWKNGGLIGGIDIIVYYFLIKK